MVVFLTFLLSLMDAPLQTKKSTQVGKKKGFKVSKLTMKTLPTNRYDIILELLEVHLPSIHLQIILHGRDYEITYPCY